jgi:pyruvate dehydrogenase E1 component beta subunit
MLHFSLDAAQQLTKEGIAAEVLDVRSLAPIDYQTVGDSVKKTGRVVIVEEGPKTGGVSAEIAAGIQERFAQYLKAPVIRVASPDIPVPFSPILENAYRPSVAQIVQAVRAVTTPHAKPQRRKG